MTNVIPQWHLSTSQVPSSYLIGQHGCGPFPPSQTASWTRMRADCHPWHPGVLPPGTAWPGFLSGTSIRTSRMLMSTTCCSRTSSSGPTTRSRWLPTTAPGWASTAAKSPSGRYREVSGDSGRCFSFSKVCACGILYSPSPNVGFPGGSDGKESTCLSGDLGFIPGSGRSLGPDNHDSVITHLEPDILECEVKWALGSITMNKASGGDGIPVELFQILKDESAALNMPANLENSAVATGLEKVSFHSNP